MKACRSTGSGFKLTVSRVSNNFARRRNAAPARPRRHSGAGCQPNHIAVACARNQHRHQPDHLRHPENPYFISVIRGVQDSAYANRMSIVLCNSDEDERKQQLYLQVIRSEHVAGLIIIPANSRDSAAFARLVQAGIPIILLDRMVDNLRADTVTVDNVRGAYRSRQPSDRAGAHRASG
ncbi:MAG: hypothetical protein U0521_03290 [Anaerolineae bacterium]